MRLIKKLKYKIQMLKFLLEDPVYYFKFNETLNKLIREGKVLRKEIDGIPHLKLARSVREENEVKEVKS